MSPIVPSRLPAMLVRRRSSWFVALAVVVCSGQAAWALITGGEGNQPIRDPGWPKGAAAVFNTKSRIAYWEGPPFGGGQWHAECRGDNAALEQVLKAFARVDIPNKRVVLHDGVGHSFWLNPNREKEKAAQAKLDWVFMVWEPERLKFQQRLPEGTRAAEQDAVLAQLDVNTGGSIQWARITVPPGIEIVDERQAASRNSKTAPSPKEP